MQGFVNYKPTRYGPRSRQYLPTKPQPFVANDALTLTGFSYSCVEARRGRCSLVHRAGSRFKPVTVSGGNIPLPDLGD